MSPSGSESGFDIPHSLRDSTSLAEGLSSSVHRLDAVAKVYSSDSQAHREREVAVYARLQTEPGVPHPAILRYHGVLDGNVVILQFARNGTIRQYLSRNDREPLPLSVRLRWAEQVADAFTYIHSKNVLHSNICANNIFLDENLNAMVGDFGGSTIDDQESLILYEISHAHPDTKEPTEQSEILALGMTFFEILGGQQPFKGLGLRQVEDHFRNGRCPSLEGIPAFRDIILKCWKGEYGTMADLLRDVRDNQTPDTPSLPEMYPQPPSADLLGDVMDNQTPYIPFLPEMYPQPYSADFWRYVIDDEIPETPFLPEMYPQLYWFPLPPNFY